MLQAAKNVSVRDMSTLETKLATLSKEALEAIDMPAVEGSNEDQSATNMARLTAFIAQKKGLVEFWKNGFPAWSDLADQVGSYTESCA